MSERFFATCPRGLEAVLQDELAAIGAQQIEAVAGGVGFAGDWPVCYRANLWSRIATRILWRVGQFPYRSENDLYAAARELPWWRWFEVDRTIRVGVSAIRSPVKSLDFVALRVKDALCDAFRARCNRRPSVDTARPDVRVHVFLTEAEATLYLDTSGEPLYKRGFKQASVEAPLKENLAAGMLRLADWQADEALLDPMCGSGTLPLEAAMIALDIAPGLGRGFGIERLAIFDRAVLAPLVTEARERQRPRVQRAIFGADLYGEQVKRAHANLAAAGLDQVVQLKQANLLELSPPFPCGVLVTNPPYGVRMDETESLAEFYPRLGDALKQRYAGWRCYFLSGDAQLAKRIGLRSSRRIPLYNGAIECRLYEYRIVQGTIKARPAAPA
jgi:putative N6-adenine-specific DNA methylase